MWLIDWLTDYLTDYLTDWLADWLTDYLTDWLADWLIDLTNWLTDWLKLFCETSLKNEALKFEAQKRSFCARLPSKTKLWRSKTKHFCETSFKIEAWKVKNEAFLRDVLQNETLMLKNEAFLRDFLQKWSFEAQKRSFCARLPSKMKLWSSKTKLFCARLPSKMKLWSSKTKLLRETSFKKEALKIKDQAFLRDFVEKWEVDRTLHLRILIRFNDFYVDASKILRLPRKSWAEAYELL